MSIKLFRYSYEQRKPPLHPHPFGHSITTQCDERIRPDPSNDTAPITPAPAHQVARRDERIRPDAPLPHPYHAPEARAPLPGPLWRESLPRGGFVAEGSSGVRPQMARDYIQQNTQQRRTSPRTSAPACKTLRQE